VAHVSITSRPRASAMAVPGAGAGAESADDWWGGCGVGLSSGWLGMGRVV